MICDLHGFKRPTPGQVCSERGSSLFTCSNWQRRYIENLIGFAKPFTYSLPLHMESRGKTSLIHIIKMNKSLLSLWEKRLLDVIFQLKMTRRVVNPAFGLCAPSAMHPTTCLTRSVTRWTSFHSRTKIKMEQRIRWTLENTVSKEQTTLQSIVILQSPISQCCNLSVRYRWLLSSHLLPIPIGSV